MLEALPISRSTLNHPVKKMFLGTGSDVSINTLYLMKQIIRESSQNWYVRRSAEHIIEDMLRDDMARLHKVFNYIAAHTRYIHDPAHYELIKTPIVSLQLIESGGTPIMDCDDYVVLSLSLLSSIGFLTAIRATWYDDMDNGHVYGMININKQWTPLDLTEPQRGFGWEGNNAKKVITIEI